MKTPSVVNMIALLATCLFSNTTTWAQTDEQSPDSEGMVTASAAANLDPDFFVTADITGVELVDADGAQILQIKGTIDADKFKRAWMQIGSGSNPETWKFVGQKRKYPIRDGVLGYVPLAEFSGADVWQIVINVEHRNGERKSDRHPVRIN